ncbi:hypothetical protein RD792_014755 [Penstemon davidsonii]|uniref:Pentatricopeptide repeat-containing protein n=1 Tax=Penstemon davidsonii TaxID=160366 RepID=A0ABR0CQB5_9LAMI|nr:hypothetical protein RD792_014755 [Penstemon davidsonii]
MISPFASSLCMLPSPSTEPEQRHALKSLSKRISETLRTELVHKFNSPLELKQVHAVVIKTSTPLSALPLSRVASVCALTPNFTYAQKIFNQLDQPQVFIWNCCLRNFAKSDSPFDAILLFYQMRMHNVHLDSFTCSFVLKACV